MDVLPRGARRKFVVPSHLMDRSTDRWRATAGVHGTVDVVTSTEQMPGRSEPLFEERGSAFMSCLLLAWSNTVHATATLPSACTSPLLSSTLKWAVCCGRPEREGLSPFLALLAKLGGLWLWADSFDFGRSCWIGGSPRSPPIFEKKKMQPHAHTRFGTFASASASAVSLWNTPPCPCASHVRIVSAVAAWQRTSPSLLDPVCCCGTRRSHR